MKWIISVTLGVMIVLVACTDSSLQTETDYATSIDSKISEEDYAGYLTDMQLEMLSIIKQNLKVVTVYEMSEGEAGDRDEAMLASNRIANELRGMEGPADINPALQADMSESVELLALYFEERAAAIGSNRDNADMIAALEEFHQKIGETFENAGLHAPDFRKDLY